MVGSNRGPSKADRRGPQRHETAALVRRERTTYPRIAFGWPELRRRGNSSPDIGGSDFGRVPDRIVDVLRVVAGLFSLKRHRRDRRDICPRFVRPIERRKAGRTGQHAISMPGCPAQRDTVGLQGVRTGFENVGPDDRNNARSEGHGIETKGSPPKSWHHPSPIEISWQIEQTRCHLPRKPAPGCPAPPPRTRALVCRNSKNSILLRDPSILGAARRLRRLEPMRHRLARTRVLLPKPGRIGVSISKG